MIQENNNFDGENVVFEAIKMEYRDMASWYDWFWGSYTAGTLKKPVNKVIMEQNDAIFTLVDVGSGTGEFLRLLKSHFFVDNKLQLTNGGQKWIGVEPSKEMMEEAQKKFPQGNDDIVSFKQSPAEKLPVDNSFADIVVSTNAFHFFRNKEVALQEMKRVLKQDGKLIITDWCNDYWIVKLYHFMERLRWNWRFKDLYPGPLTKNELFQLAQNAGFANIRISKYRVRVFAVFFWGMQTIVAEKE